MIVIEASAMVDALVGEPANPQLLAVLADEELHAPALLDFEVTSAPTRTSARPQAETHQVGRRCRRFRGAADRAAPPHHSLLRHLLRLRDNFTVYDAAAYVVLAQALDAPLNTSDTKLAEAERFGVRVVFAPNSESEPN